MTPYLFWELLFLGIGVWVLALTLVVYAWFLLHRQKQFMVQILSQLSGCSGKEESKETLGNMHLPEEKSIAISKDEPISKYADMAVDDSVNVSFIEPPPHDKI